MVESLVSVGIKTLNDYDTCFSALLCHVILMAVNYLLRTLTVWVNCKRNTKIYCVMYLRVSHLSDIFYKAKKF